MPSSMEQVNETGSQPPPRVSDAAKKQLGAELKRKFLDAIPDAGAPH